MSKLDKAKEVIKEYCNDAYLGIFSTRNIAGDYMETIYEDDELQIDIRYGYSYFEVFGLSEEEFEKLSDFYESCVHWAR